MHQLIACCFFCIFPHPPFHLFWRDDDDDDTNGTHYYQAAQRKRSPPPVQPKKARPVSVPANFLQVSWHTSIWLARPFNLIRGVEFLYYTTLAKSHFHSWAIFLFCFERLNPSRIFFSMDNDRCRIELPAHIFSFRFQSPQSFNGFYGVNVYTHHPIIRLEIQMRGRAIILRLYPIRGHRRREIESPSEAGRVIRSSSTSV